MFHLSLNITFTKAKTQYVVKNFKEAFMFFKGKLADVNDMMLVTMQRSDRPQCRKNEKQKYDNSNNPGSYWQVSTRQTSVASLPLT